ncbi:MAG: TrbI/VirB10 family protein [Asticcacaulis sp.]|uniref:TrbI/VirB10 family protein n=1 Tax=Asticcacaulis sp. TaxID=1872648 RepID=UPI0039E51731
MTDTIPSEKLDPETLVLRAKPRRVVRIKRNLLIGVTAVGCVALVGLVWLGLGPSMLKPAAPAASDKDPEKHKAGLPDQVSALPKTYADVPQLGQPLPGDLGRPILEHQRTHGGVDGTAGVSADRGGGRQSPAETARTSGLFFATNDKVAPTVASNANDAVTALNRSLMALPTGATGAAPVGQAAKVAFIEGTVAGATVNPFAVQPPASPYMVMAGTVISASLVTGLNSDLPGLVLAQVTSDVHDSLTGRLTLIPAGTRLIGKYDSSLSFGQSRVLVVWQRLIWPDGRSLVIDNLPGADVAGFAGLSDKVDYHIASLLKGIGLSTLLGVTGELGRDTDDDLIEALRRSVQDTSNQAGQKIVSRQLDVQPTLAVRPGAAFRVIVQKDLDLSPIGEGL